MRAALSPVIMLTNTEPPLNPAMSSAPRLALVVVAMNLSVLLASPAAPAPDKSAERLFNLLQQWLVATNEHRPGHRDAAVDRIAAWTDSDLDAMVPFMETLFLLLREPGDPDILGSDVGRPRTLPARLIRKGIDEVMAKRIDTLARGERARGDDNRVLKRGAMLHADIMMSGAAKRKQGTDLYAVRREALPGESVAVTGIDGQQEGFAVVALHWPFARMILDWVRPNPTTDEFVRLWYRAVSAYLLNGSVWNDAERHLQRARERLPFDAVVQFDSGTLYEAYASPRAQAMMAASRKRGVTLRVAGPAVNLRLGELYFTQASALDASLIEARVRRGRVRIAMRRPKDALPELEEASVSAADPVVRYYAALFLGEAQVALGDDEAARGAYGRATALFPMSQAPQIALSLLAREADERDAAHAALEHFLLAPVADRIRYDPWWTYFLGGGRNMRTRVSELWAAVPPAGVP
jgi:hypothetical protein